MALSPPRILIVRTSSLGDVVRTVPALVSLRAAYPDAQIDWLVNDTFLPAIQHHPALSRAIPFPRRRVGEWLKSADLDSASAWLADTIGPVNGAPRYDRALDFQGLFRSGLLTWTTRAPQRIGFADAREFGWLGYTRRIRVPRDTHHVDRYLHLLREIGVPPVADMRLYPGAEAERRVNEDPALRGRMVVVAPTTRGLGRAWPIERYAELAPRLLRESSLGIERLCIVGLASERAYCEPLLARVRNDPRSIDRVGGTTLPQLMALIARAELVVCNDSAAMHLAVAFDRPLVALLGPTRVELSGPYRRDADVVTRRTEADAKVRHRDVNRASEIMRRVTVDEVFAACERRLA